MVEVGMKLDLVCCWRGLLGPLVPRLALSAVLSSTQGARGEH